MPNTREDAYTGPATQVPIGPVLRQPVVRWFFASTFFHVLAHMAVYLFFSLYLDAHGYSKSTIGLLWAVSVVVEVAWFFTQSRWLPRWPLTGWVVLCALAMALRMGMTTLGGAWLVCLVAAQVLHALTFAAHHTACIGLISHYFPARLRGRGQALYAVLAYGFPGVLGGLGGGWLGSRWGLDAVYAVAAFSALLAAACAWQVARLERAAHARVHA